MAIAFLCRVLAITCTIRLANIRHEKFAQLVASGAIACNEYEEAGERLMAMKRNDYVGELQRWFLTLPPSKPATMLYGEMLAKAMGWDKPETITASTPQIRSVIGGCV